MKRDTIVRSALRTAVPFSAWQMAGFVKRIPGYWRLDRSDALRIRKGISGLPIFVTPEVHVFSPEHLTAYICWQKHGIDSVESATEIVDFLELSKDKKALIDIGAHTGFMSALFARSRSRPYHILSVEPDPDVLPALKRAVALNRGMDAHWSILEAAVSDRIGRMSKPVTNLLYENAQEAAVRLNAHVADADIVDEVKVTTLSDLLANLDWQPDIMKIDVESFEHEILCSSLDLIEKLRPALQLEVHWQMLKSREKNAEDFLAPLSSLGYRGIRSRYRTLDKWMRAGRSEGVSRFALRTA